MSDGPLTYQQAAGFLASLTQQMRDATGELRQAHERLADDEAEYRRQQAQAWATVEGSNALERDAKVKAATADYRRARDIAKGRIDVAKATLQRLDREAASTRFLGAWAQSERGQYQ